MDVLAFLELRGENSCIIKRIGRRKGKIFQHVSKRKRILMMTEEYTDKEIDRREERRQDESEAEYAVLRFVPLFLLFARSGTLFFIRAVFCC